MPKSIDSVGQVLKCPYMSRPVKDVELDMKEERFDFQIEENGKIGRVSLGVFDILKEVNSHNGEVGLINVLKLAAAKGIDPSVYAKTEPGLMVDVSDIETYDDLINAQKDAEERLAKIAADAGLSVDELLAIVKSGDYSKLEKHEGGTDDGANAQE